MKNTFGESTLLEFKDIGFTYPRQVRNEPVDEVLPRGIDLDRKRTLQNISFGLRRGEWVALLGANGSGKSTLARLANGLLLPNEGEVIADGISSWKHDSLSELRKLVGLVTQDPDNQIVSTTVFDEIAFGPQNLGWGPSRIYAEVSDALESIGLPENEFAKRDPNSLSGGEKQRVVIAAILAMHPNYLVLDEPTAMLDPISRAHVLEAIAQAVRNNHGVLHITHVLREAAFAHRVLVLESGRLVYDGAPEGILHDEAALTRYGLMAKPAVTGRLGSVAGIRRKGESENDGPGNALDESTANVLGQSTRATLEGGSRNVLDGIAGHALETDSKDSQRRDDSVSNTQDLKPELPALGEDLNLSRVSGKDFRLRFGTIFGDATVLELNKVAFSYHDTSQKKAVLEDFNLWVESEECVLLVGQSGSGKSTALSLAAGLLQPHLGKVRLNGKTPLPGQVGIVFQQPETQLFAQTLKEDILFGPKNLGTISEAAGEKLVDEVLAAVGLSPQHFKNRSPFSLSGGEARRAAIATTLALKTDILLLDEPTAGLDARGKVFIYELIQSLLAQGKGVVIATHDPDFFVSLATGRVEL